MEIVWAILLVLVVILLWSLNIVGLPGNWLVVAAAAIYALLVPEEWRTDVGWWSVAALGGLAVVGEIIEFLAGAMGASKAGGSRRGAVLALLGSLGGGLLGIFVGVPIPIVGPIIGALAFASLGALTGAVIGEQWKGKTWDESFRVGHAAFWGRLLGTLGKALVGTFMIVVVLVSVFL
jgi:uncharacterized protein YqgC (DUF456 family)